MSRGNGSTQLLALRRRLDTMGYEDFVLGLDSAPLAQQLLNDVYTTTKELQRKEKELDEVQAELEKYQPQIEIYQEQQQRLTRENVQLHRKIISVSEEAKKTVDQSTIAMIEAQTECRKIKLFCDQKEQIIKDLQAQLEKTKLELQEAIENPAALGGTSSYRTRDQSRSRRTGSRSRRTGSMAPSIDRSSCISQQEHEMEVKTLKDEIEQLKETVDNKESEVQGYVSKINQQEDLIKLRDTEILRLGQELQNETGRDGYMMSLRHMNQQQASEIEKLQAQVLYGGNSILSPSPSISSSSTQHSRQQNATPQKTNHQKDEDIPTPRQPPQPLFASKNSSSPVQQNEEPIKEVSENSLHVVFDIPQEEKDITISILGEEEEEEEKAEAKSNTESLYDSELRDKLNEYEDKIGELKHENEELSEQLDKATEIIGNKDAIIAQMTADIAFTGDSLNVILKEKDRIISQLRQYKDKQDDLQKVVKEQKQLIEKQNENVKVEEYKEKMETLQMQLDELNAKYESENEEKDSKIAQLESLVEQITNDNAQQTTEQQIIPLTECKECAKLRAQLEELKKNSTGMSQEDTIELQNLRERTAQLELIIRSSEETMRESNNLNQELLIAQNKITEREQQYERLRQAGLRLQKEMQQVKQELEEERKTSGMVPELKQRYRTILERMKIEHTATVEELKQTKATLQTISDKLLESQKLTRMFQDELQKSRDMANKAKEEALLYRTKNEEIQQLASEKLVNCQKEMNAASNHYKSLVKELSNKNSALTQMLGDTRRQTALYEEQAVPKLKEQVLKLTRERAELSARVESLAQLSQFAEKSTKFSPETVQFIAALHQLQDTLRPFLP